MLTQAVILGRVLAPHGLKGWVKLASFTRPIEQIFAYDYWYLPKPAQLNRLVAGVAAQATEPAVGQAAAIARWSLIDYRQHGRALMARLDGCDCRTQAEQLLDRQIVVDRRQLPPLAAGEYYWTDLLGLQVVNTDGVVFGTLTEMLETGANDVMRVQGVTAAADGPPPAERLIPWIPRVVVEVDRQSNRLLVDWDATF